METTAASTPIPWSNMTPATNFPIHCKTGDLTDVFGLVIQLSLGILAFSALLVKWRCEKQPERRAWHVFVFDSSKQALGTVAVHFFNIFISRIPKGNSNDPCFWYMFNYLLDCTIGLAVMWLGLKGLTYVTAKWLWLRLYINQKNRYEKLTFHSIKVWFVQTLMFVLLTFGEKLLIFGFSMVIFSIFSFSFLETMQINPEFEIALSMLIVPFIINVIWFWIVDNLLMQMREGDEEPRNLLPSSSHSPISDDPPSTSTSAPQSHTTTFTRNGSITTFFSAMNFRNYAATIWMRIRSRRSSSADSGTSSLKIDHAVDEETVNISDSNEDDVAVSSSPKEREDIYTRI